MDGIFDFSGMEFGADMSDFSSKASVEAKEHVQEAKQPCGMVQRAASIKQAVVGFQRLNSIDSVMSETTQFDSVELTLEEKEQLLDNIADSLREQCELNDPYATLPARSDPTAIFFSEVPSNIDIRFYATRLVKYLDISPAAFVAAMVYLAQLRSTDAIRINSYNVHRLLLSAVNVGMKYTEDVCYSARSIARVGGISDSKEVSRLERQMLALLNFELFIDTKRFTESRAYLLLSHK
ncbi:Cyclin-P3-1 [Porphyridium purpureum]|uniref:Cyclin-P3-1 n=1 Tax=Porphyridium purpureum TaxID=35688 RepID=A0A5J4YMX5_PORPP|nr:Cyclin-P3-1 [Porphyridium purpureum]|eukprot:POR5846..scf244_11